MAELRLFNLLSDHFDFIHLILIKFELTTITNSYLHFVIATDVITCQ